jgi:carbonic anhydrase
VPFSWEPFGFTRRLAEQAERERSAPEPPGAPSRTSGAPLRARTGSPGPAPGSPAGSPAAPPASTVSPTSPPARVRLPAGSGAAGSSAATGLRREPARRLVVITCMDARIDPLALLGLRVGDAHVLRNAGATVSRDVLRSLHLSASTMGTERALLVGHTDCAAHDSDAAAEVALLQGLKRIRASGMVPSHFAVEALIFDVRTGALDRLALGTKSAQI